MNKICPHAFSLAHWRTASFNEVSRRTSDGLEGWRVDRETCTKTPPADERQQPQLLLKTGEHLVEGCKRHLHRLWGGRSRHESSTPSNFSGRRETTVQSASVFISGPSACSASQPLLILKAPHSPGGSVCACVSLFFTGGVERDGGGPTHLIQKQPIQSCSSEPQQPSPSSPPSSSSAPFILLFNLPGEQTSSDRNQLDFKRRDAETCHQPTHQTV